MRKGTGVRAYQRIMICILCAIFAIGYIPMPEGAILAPMKAKAATELTPGTPYTITSTTSWPIEIKQNGEYTIEGGDAPAAPASVSQSPQGPQRAWVVSAGQNGIVVSPGVTATITLDNVHIITPNNGTTGTSGTAVTNTGRAMWVQSAGAAGTRSNSTITTDVTVQLIGRNTLWTGYDSGNCSAAGLETQRGSKLTIDNGSGDPENPGMLLARSAGPEDYRYNSSVNNGGGAGIGAGNFYESGGNIVIRGGKIWACGGAHAASIGDAWGSRMTPTNSGANTAALAQQHLYTGTILIHGGEIHVQASGHGAGIGGACYAYSYLRPSNVYICSVVVVPPTQVDYSWVGSSYYTGPNFPGTLGGAKDPVYIGDGSEYTINVTTSDARKNIDIYFDINNPALVSKLALLNPVDLNPARIKWGRTDTVTGIASQPAAIPNGFKFFTDTTINGYTYTMAEVNTTPSGKNGVSKNNFSGTSALAPDHAYLNYKLNLQMAVVKLSYINPVDLNPWFQGYGEDATEITNKSGTLRIENAGVDPVSGLYYQMNTSGQNNYWYSLDNGATWNTWAEIQSLLPDALAVGAFVNIKTRLKPGFNGPYSTTGQLELGYDYMDYSNVPYKTFTQQVNMRPVTAVLSAQAIVSGEEYEVVANFRTTSGAEMVKDLTTAGITVINGTVTGAPTPVGSSPYASRWTFKVTPTTGLANNTLISVTVNANAATDNHGIGNSVSNTIQSKYVENAPTVTFGYDTSTALNNEDIVNKELSGIWFDLAANGGTLSTRSEIYVGSSGGAKLDGSTSLTDSQYTLKKGGTTFPATVNITNNKVTLTGTFDDGDYVLTLYDDQFYNDVPNPLEKTVLNFKIRIPGIEEGDNYPGTTPPAGSSVGYGIEADPGELNPPGGTTTVKVYGKNLQYAGNDLQILLPAGVAGAGTKVTPTSVAADGKSAELPVTLPQNPTALPVPYTFTLYFNGSVYTQGGVDSTATATVKAASPGVNTNDPNSGLPKGLAADPDLFTYKGGVTTLTVNGKNLNNYVNLRIVDNFGNSYPITGLPSWTDKTQVDVLLPKNTSSTDIVYTYKLYHNTNDEIDDGSGGEISAQVKVQGSYPLINDFTVSGKPIDPDNPGEHDLRIERAGGTVYFMVDGMHLNNFPGLAINGAPAATALTLQGVDNEMGTASTVLPINLAPVPVTYTYTLTYTGIAAPMTVTVTVAPSIPQVTDFSVSDAPGGAKTHSLVLDDNGGTAYFTVDGLFMHNFPGMSISGAPAATALTLSGADNELAEASVALPANRTRQDIEYTYTLENADGTQRTVRITVQKPTSGPTAVSPDYISLGASGGTVSTTIIGKNMEIASLELHDKNDSSIVYNVPCVGTNVSSATAALNMPEHSGGLRNDIYEYEVWFDGYPTELFLTVEVGDSVPNLTGLTANPTYIVINDASAKCQSVITVHGNYLFNFPNLQLYDVSAGQTYNVSTAGKDMSADHRVYLPGIGVYQFNLLNNGEETGYSVEIVVDEGKADDDKHWTRLGGGTKGKGFTGRLYVSIDALRHQCMVAATEDPVNPMVALANIPYVHKYHFMLAWSGGKLGMEASKLKGEGIMTLIFDTLRKEDDSKLEGRLIIKNDRPLPGMYPGVYLDEAETGKTKALFDNRFDNKNLTVICLDNNGKYSTAESITVEIAADADLTGYDLNNLRFYRYDRETGEYEPMKNTNHFVDTEYFLHFYTKIGGDIIVTDKPLTINGKVSEEGSFEIVKKVPADKNRGGAVK